MTTQYDSDSTLIGMPSLRGIKSFLATAKYRSFSGAASALCVTQAAVSKQVRELESYLGAELFVRLGRTVSLTADGEMFKDAAQLSFINILQAAERLRKRMPVRQTLTVCCSPAFSSMWLQHRLPDFLDAHPEVEFTVLATQNFLAMEAGVQPDVYIAKMAVLHEGYDSTQLFDDEVYPICTPQFIERFGPLNGPDDLLKLPLLDLSPYGRAQVSEHVDWKVWLGMQVLDIDLLSAFPSQPYSSNDYSAVVHMALAHRGLALGWHHLVGHLVESGELVRPIPQKVSLKNRSHYLAIRKDKAQSEIHQSFCLWVREQFAHQFPA